MLDLMSDVRGLTISGPTFVSHFVHDLRACFRAIETLPDWIDEDLEAVAEQVPDEVFKHLKQIKISARRADRSVNDMRELCEIDTKTEACIEFELGAAIRIYLRENPLPDGFEIKLDLADQQLNLPKAGFDSVLVALLGNAVKHYGADCGTVYVSNTNTQGALVIGDDGVGVALEYRDRIFDPLATLRPRDVAEGSGLGLTIARRRVEGWGGTLRAISHPVIKGTVFEIKFADST